eukprot:4668049-Pleurochrysis_carterae.AAC.1
MNVPQLTWIKGGPYYPRGCLPHVLLDHALRPTCTLGLRVLSSLGGSMCTSATAAVVVAGSASTCSDRSAAAVSPPCNPSACARNARNSDHLHVGKPPAVAAPRQTPAAPPTVQMLPPSSTPTQTGWADKLLQTPAACQSQSPRAPPCPTT